MPHQWEPAGQVVSHRRPHRRGGNRRGIGGGAESLILPVAPNLIIAQWVADRGVVGAPSAVTSWTDIVNNNVVAEATDTPTLVTGATPSGRPAIRFDGTNDLLRMASFDLSGYQDVDLWFVAKRTQTGVAQNIIDFDGTVRVLHNSRSDDFGQAAVTGNVGLDNEYESDATLLDSWRVYNCRFRVSQAAGSEGQFFFNSALTQGDTRGINSNNTDANLGSGELTFCERATSAGGANNYGGDIWCVAFTDTSADRTAIAQFLAAKSGAP